MGSSRYDVLVVGAGPAGSVAALVLARSGARVALVDKSRFPRDKACGDLVGPRGLKVLDDLGVPEPPGLDVGDMVVVGPTGRRVLLPCFDGLTYPGRARAVTRTVFDHALRAAALDAGAEEVDGRAGRPLWSGPNLEGFRVGDHELRGDFVIGADGAASHVADSAGLVDPSRVLWGFAVRCYFDQPVRLPVITLWEQKPWRAFAGYGWIFPGPDGVANAGLGLGTLSHRQSGAEAVRQLPAYLDHLVEIGLLDKARVSPLPRRLGGWLKMGMLGTIPAAGRVLLVGDAAGLVNPLQGEGIAPAMTSGRAAADAILTAPGDASGRYRRHLARDHLPYHRVAAAGHAALVPHPMAVAAVGRALTLPPVGRALAGGWGIFWNELLDGAVPGRARTIAAASTRIGGVLAGATAPSRWLSSCLGAARAQPRSGAGPPK